MRYVHVLHHLDPAIVKDEPMPVEAGGDDRVALGTQCIITIRRSLAETPAILSATYLAIA